MLKRIHGIAISLKASRIFKHICPVILAFLALLLFFSSGARTFASSTDYTENTFISNWQHQYAINNYKRYDPVIDWISSANNLIFGYYDMSVNVQGYNYPFQDSGVAQYTGALTDTYYVEIGTAINGDNWSTYIQPAVINSSSECYVSYSNMTWDRTRNVSSFYVYVTQVLDKANITEVPVEYDVQLKFKLAFWSITTLTPPHTFTVTHTDFHETHFGEYSDSFVLQNIANMLQDIVVSDNVTVLQSIDSNIQAQNDLLENDSTGSASATNIITNSYDQANAAADTAVDSAVHNYDYQLQQVEDLDFSSFFNTQRYSLNFWRSVGEFILDSGNLGYIATGLIVVTVINLFVFMLRL